MSVHIEALNGSMPDIRYYQRPRAVPVHRLGGGSAAHAAMVALDADAVIRGDKTPHQALDWSGIDFSRPPEIPQPAKPCTLENIITAVRGLETKSPISRSEAIIKVLSEPRALPKATPEELAEKHITMNGRITNVRLEFGPTEGSTTNQAELYARLVPVSTEPSPTNDGRPHKRDIFRSEPTSSATAEPQSLLLTTLSEMTALLGPNNKLIKVLVRDALRNPDPENVMHYVQKLIDMEMRHRERVQEGYRKQEILLRKDRERQQREQTTQPPEISHSTIIVRLSNPHQEFVAVNGKMHEIEPYHSNEDGPRVDFVRQELLPPDLLKATQEQVTEGTMERYLRGQVLTGQLTLLAWAQRKNELARKDPTIVPTPGMTVAVAETLDSMFSKS